MALTEQDFINAISKIAESELESNEDQVVAGEQEKAVPELLQPDDGPKGDSAREAIESLSTGAEKAHSENREGEYLPNAFDGFKQNARQTGAELSNLLDNYGPSAAVSSATAAAGRTKISSAQISAFQDELAAIWNRK